MSKRDEIAYREYLESFGEIFDKGHDYLLMYVISLCAEESIPLPHWAAKAFIKAYEKVRSGNVNSWDASFGTPFRKGANLNAIRKRLRLRPLIFDRICEIRKAAPKTPIDAELFARVGKEFNLGKTLTAEYYYEEQTFRRSR